MKGPKKLLALIGTLVIVGAMLMPLAVFGDTEDTATGTFSNNNVPNITSVELWNISGPAEVTAMTPQVTYDVRVKVTDADGLADLTTIVVKIYRDTDASADETEFNAESADTQNCAVITWTQSGDLFSIAPSSSTTWGFTEVDCVTGTADSGTAFQFKFTVGKVATEAAGAATDCWRVAALVTDDSSGTDFGFDVSDNSMAWYGEISGVSGTVDWGTVNAGMAIGEGAPSEKTLGVTVKYLANGPYDEKVKSDATWPDVPDNTADATLDEDGLTLASNAFSLKADDTATLGSEVFVTVAGVAIDESGTQTAEAGHDAADNTLWLQLASTFIKDTYSGTITYIIANGS